MEGFRGREVWVLGAGTAGRRDSIARHFRRRGISAIGPSGVASEIEGKRRANTVRRFSEANEDGAQERDAVILRNGTTKILDVGILGEYKHIPSLGVTGWDLGHVRSTYWLDLEDGELERLNKLRESAKKRFGQDAFHRLNDEHSALRAHVEKLVSAANPPPDKLGAPKGREDSLDIEELKTRVCDEVNSGIDSEELLAVLTEADDFGIHDYDRLEADTVAMILVPLLRVLGVDYKRLRVEVPLKVLDPEVESAQRVDLVVLEDADPAEPRLIIEAKRRWSGLDWAVDQLDGYTQQFSSSDGQPIPSVVTDGSEFIVRNLPGQVEDLEFSLRWRDADTVRGLTSLAKYVAP